MSERNEFPNDSHLRDCDDCAYVAAQAEAEGRRRGWNAALDAAREAVCALMDDGSDRCISGKNQPDEDYYWAIDDAAAAIDALRKNA